MKHSAKITMVLIAIFLFTQLFGLATVGKYIQVSTDATGKIVISHPDTAVGQPPQISEKNLSFIPIIIAVLIGTALVFLLIKFSMGFLWKYWFLFAVFITMSVTFGVYMNILLALILAFILAIIKVFKNNVIIHNFTEIFVYTGITLILISLLNVRSAIFLLIAISIYDMIAVWKSGHMIKLAEFQASNKIFAGLFIPGNLKAGFSNITTKKDKHSRSKKNISKSAILGGGDIAFPLLFSAAVMENMIIVQELTKPIAFLYTTIISITTAIALGLLLAKSKKGKFYPAMPFISAGCFIGYGIILLIGLI